MTKFNVLMYCRNYCNKPKEDHAISTPYSLITEALEPANRDRCDQLLAEAVSYDVNVTRAVATVWINTQVEL